MDRTAGYYSCIQYQPCPGRAEAVNFGILAYCPKEKYVGMMFCESNERPIRFFPDLDDEWLNEMKDWAKNIVTRNLGDSFTLEQFEHWRNCLGNDVRFTQLKSSVFDESCEKTLQRLYDYFVKE